MCLFVVSMRRQLLPLLVYNDGSICGCKASSLHMTGRCGDAAAIKCSTLTRLSMFVNALAFAVSTLSSQIAPRNVIRELGCGFLTYVHSFYNVANAFLL